MMAPIISMIVMIKNLPSPTADMVGTAYELSPPARWNELKMSQPSHAPTISARMYITPRITEIRRVAIIPTVIIGLMQAPEKA